MFHPHTDADRKAMLNDIGVESIDDFFKVVPKEHRYPDLDLPERLTEMEALSGLKEIASANETVDDLPSFLGAGAYNHYIPAAVDAILRRGEFYTAYTPYQPEISQGTLQTIFEFQSLMINLTGMEVSNASHYDGASAVAEAINMSMVIHHGKRPKVVMSPGLHPQYTATVRTYLRGSELSVVESSDSHYKKPEELYELIDDDTGIVVVQYPDFFGQLFDYQELADVTNSAGALLCVAVNPIALGLFNPPGEFGADIVVGEGQPLGIPLSYGGPYLGFLTTKEKYVRSMAGRLVGETEDVNGQKGYVLTLNTREQHIRRERASSNICTNQALMALAATVYLSLLGKGGLKEMAELCFHKAHYLASEIGKLEGFELFTDELFFNEFVIKVPGKAAEVNKILLENDIIGGYDLGLEYHEMEDCMLLAVTEMNSKQEMDVLVGVLEEIANG